jgi:hypothetical protein
MAAKTTTPPEPEPQLDHWDTNESTVMLACYLQDPAVPGDPVVGFRDFRAGWEQGILDWLVEALA